ncbi:MAG: hypothetical protein OXN25_14770 [Candidatus Poribacteria bacterium]|nr:hypothetical protein [Candidatus Poribacteria bacterium]
MIQGRVSDAGVPVITLSIEGQAWEATIDTGFNGDLELSEALRDRLNPQYIGKVTSVLAGGQRIVEELYRVNFPFDGKMIQAEATFVVGSEILIGTHLLREYRLQIDFVRRTIMLERDFITEASID